MPALALSGCGGIELIVDGRTLFATADGETPLVRNFTETFLGIGVIEFIRDPGSVVEDPLSMDTSNITQDATEKAQRCWAFSSSRRFGSHCNRPAPTPKETPL